MRFTSAPNRQTRRRAGRAAPAPVSSLSMWDEGDGHIWLDVAGKAGLRFLVDEWQQLCAEAVVLLAAASKPETAPGEAPWPPGKTVTG